MTKRTYRKPTRVSRVGASPQAPPRRSPPRQQPVSTNPPFPRRFEALAPEGDEHPIDVLVARMPAVATIHRRLRRASDALRKCVTDRRKFIAYEDLWTEYTVRREQRYFDAGFAHGQLAGRAESGAASIAATPAARALARQIMLTATTSQLRRDRMIAVLLELARAIVLGLRLPSRPSRRGRR